MHFRSSLYLIIKWHPSCLFGSVTVSAARRRPAYIEWSGVQKRKFLNRQYRYAGVGGADSPSRHLSQISGFSTAAFWADRAQVWGIWFLSEDSYGYRGFRGTSTLDRFQIPNVADPPPRGRTSASQACLVERPYVNTEDRQFTLSRYSGRIAATSATLNHSTYTLRPSFLTNQV